MQLNLPSFLISVENQFYICFVLVINVLRFRIENNIFRLYNTLFYSCL